MDEETKRKFAEQFNHAMGEYLRGLRQDAGLSLEAVAEALKEFYLERLKCVEAGEGSLRGDELLGLLKIYRVNPVEALASVQNLAEDVRIELLTQAPRA